MGAGLWPGLGGGACDPADWNGKSARGAAWETSHNAQISALPDGETGSAEASDRVGASKVVDLFRERCEKVRASRENRTRGRLWMSHAIAERGLNAAAELWVYVAERKRNVAAKRQAQQREAGSSNEHESGDRCPGRHAEGCDDGGSSLTDGEVERRRLKKF